MLDSQFLGVIFGRNNTHVCIMLVYPHTCIVMSEVWFYELSLQTCLGIMTMDKSWIAKLHTTREYRIGLEKFLDFAFKNVAVGDKIRCMVSVILFVCCCNFDCLWKLRQIL